MKIWADIFNTKTGKCFRKYFICEYDRDKYISRSKYFTNLYVYGWGVDYE